MNDQGTIIDHGPGMVRNHLPERLTSESPCRLCAIGRARPDRSHADRSTRLITGAHATGPDK